MQMKSFQATQSYINIEVCTGIQIEDNGNKFSSHIVTVESHRLPMVASASHNVFAYCFTSKDCSVHEGSENAVEHDAGRALQKTFQENGAQNTLMVVSSGTAQTYDREGSRT